MVSIGYELKVVRRSKNIVFKIPAKVYPEGSNAEVIDLKRMLRLSDRKVEGLQKSLAEVQQTLAETTANIETERNRQRKLRQVTTEIFFLTHNVCSRVISLHIII